MYICGFHLIYEFKLENVKEKNHIEGNYAERQHELIGLEIPLSEIIWVKDHEFRWKGEMYDIAEKRIDGEFLICTVYHDKEEKVLNEDYAQLPQHEKDNPANHILKYPIVQPFLSASSLCLFHSERSIELSFTDTEFISSNYSKMHHQPPDFNQA
jgi:hypothetical protein